MTLYIGNCLARYLYYLHKKNDYKDCKYKWCTNFEFLKNPPEISKSILKNVLTSAPEKYYNGFSADENYDKIVVTMSQFFVRPEYIKIQDTFLEVSKINNEKIKFHKVQNNWVNYEKYFFRYTQILKSKFPSSEIIIIFENPLPFKAFYGKYTYQFQYIENKNFSFLNEGFHLLEKRDVINSLIKKGYFFDSLYPWYTFHEGKCKVDNLHISDLYVQEIFHFLKLKKTKQKLSLENTYEINKSVNTDIKIIDNPIDLMGMMINRADSWKSIEEVVLMKYKSFTKMMDFIEQFYLNEKELTENTATLNITGYQNIITNIYQKSLELKEINSPILKELIDRYNLIISNTKAERPLYKYYMDNLNLLNNLKQAF